jgi:hypothetical protein
MSRQNFRILRLFLISATGACYLYTYIATIDDDIFTNSFILIFLIALFLITSVWSFFKDKRDYSLTHQIVSYSPAAVTLIFVSVIFITQRIMIARDSSPVLIQAGYDGGYNGTWFEFREDGTYKFANSGGISVTYIRGAYKLNKNNIVLDKSNLDGAVTTQYLSIRTNDNDDPSLKRNGISPGKVLLLVNKDNNIIDKEMIFVVHEDHRKFQ